MKLIEKLAKIQNELKAPKGQYNNFGKYKYRSCEDILEAVKPLLKREKTALKITDEIVELNGRYYIKATTTLYDLDSDETISNTAFAREEEEKKGMDGSQITGTASSYARKYCLNGLLLIDDTKDADTDEYQKQTTKKETVKKEEENYSLKLQELCKEKGLKTLEVAKKYKLNGNTKNEEFKKAYEDILRGV